ncbi:hypothetical protein BB558_006281 [Smittium angustum]|uniref:DUF7719 domain-containing protein n=1 Tax=Smittium angustum TaxID=133377 RepID=A0A2U1IY87_SMIAN|nr:hypothetical protein BB558_006281 [Smittium angustum]
MHPIETTPNLTMLEGSTTNPQDPSKDTTKGPKYLVDQIPLRKLQQNKNVSDFIQKNFQDEQDEEQDFTLPAWSISILYSTTLSIVYATFLFLVNHQYGVQILYKDIISDMISMIPAFYIFTYFTQKYKGIYLVNLAMLAMATFFGCYFIHLNLHSPRLGVMKRAPGLITLWIYLVLILDIRPTLVNVFVVISFYLLDPFKTRWN